MKSILFNLTIIQLIAISAFAVLFLIQISYYLTLFLRVAFYKTKAQQLYDVSQEGVSVVICARNENEKLTQLLPQILEQGHPTFEVIVVNNCSTDNSDEVLALLQHTYANLVTRTIALDEVFPHNNAMAWGVGIKAARYEWIVLMDVNCYPENGNWLAALQQNFTKDVSVVLSHAAHNQYSRIAQAETFFNALHYLSKACARHPYTGSGENVAFRKSLFFDNKGFNSLLKLRDKADRVFINTIAEGKNTVVDLDSDAVNTSSLPLTFSSWKVKRRDELRSQRLFRKGARYASCLELASRGAYYIAFAVALVVALTVQWAWIAVLSAFAFRLIAQIVIFTKATKRLKERKLLPTLLWWDIFAPFIYIPIIAASKVERR